MSVSATIMFVYGIFPYVCLRDLSVCLFTASIHMFVFGISPYVCLRYLSVYQLTTFLRMSVYDISPHVSLHNFSVCQFTTFFCMMVFSTWLLQVWFCNAFSLYSKKFHCILVQLYFYFNLSNRRAALCAAFHEVALTSRSARQILVHVGVFVQKPKGPSHA